MYISFIQLTLIVADKNSILRYALFLSAPIYFLLSRHHVITLAVGFAAFAYACGHVNYN